jgi:hypothetical protein
MSIGWKILLGKGQGNNLYNVRDVREITYIEIVHNIQEAETIEDMGGNIPRI